MILLGSVDRFVGTALHHSFLSLISVVICHFRFRVGLICSQMVVFMFTDGRNISYLRHHKEMSLNSSCTDSTLRLRFAIGQDEIYKSEDLEF